MSRNDITGDKLQTKVGTSKAYSEGYDRIFGNKVKVNEDSLYADHSLDGLSGSSVHERGHPRTDTKQCECPTWTLGCCGAGSKYEDK